MSLSGSTTVLGEPLLAVLGVAAGTAVAVLIALAVTLAHTRARRAAKRLRTHVDPVTGLSSRARLFRDLRVLSSDGDAVGTYLLGVFELPGLALYEREHGTPAADELLRLGRRLANAVGRAGSVYGLERGRFGVLARIGRVSDGVIVLAAVAALSDERSGVGILARKAMMTLPGGAARPRQALQLLDGLEEVRIHAVDEIGSRRTRRATAVAQRRASANAIALRSGRGSAGPALLERERPARPPRRPSRDGPSRDGRANGFGSPARASAPRAIGEAPDSIAAARSRDVPRRNPPPRWMPYMRVSTRFRLSVLCGFAWMCLSAWLAWPWIEDLARTISLPAALILITGIALIPGYLNVQLVTSLLVDHPAPIDFDFDYPALTLLVAAYNEECDIAQTLAYVLAQEYPGPLHVFVMDDGSTDETVSLAGSFARLDRARARDGGAPRRQGARAQRGSARGADAAGGHDRRGYAADARCAA